MSNRAHVVAWFLVVDQKFLKLLIKKDKDKDSSIKEKLLFNHIRTFIKMNQRFDF